MTRAFRPPDGPFAYFSRHREGGQHPLVCREPRAGGPAETMLDGDALAAGKSFFRIGAAAHSPDHRLLAWSADDSGSEIFIDPHPRHRQRRRSAGPRDRNHRRHRVVAGCAARSITSISTAITALSRVHRHRLGTRAEDDETIVAADDSGLFVSLTKVQSGRFAEVSLHDHETSECWLIDLAAGDASRCSSRRAKPRYTTVSSTTRARR